MKSKNQVDQSQTHSSDQSVSSPLDALSRRELDIAMAERVMEWKLDRTSRDAEQRIRWYVVEDCHYAVCNERDAGMINRSWWSPSTWIADAMQVVEKMESLNYQWQFSRTNPIKSIHDNKPHVEFWRYREGVLQPIGMATADALSEAICRAALAATQHNPSALGGSEKKD